MNQEFHEIKYLLCAQMFDAARIAEAFRKRALFGGGSLGVDSRPLGELLKSIFLSDTYPEASAAMNLTLFSFVQALGRHWAATASNAADAYLGTQLAQDATRFVTYGVDNVRSHLHARPLQAEALADHLDLCENALVGALGAPEMIEPLVLVSGGFAPRRPRSTRAPPTSTSAAAPRPVWATGATRARSLRSSACSKETRHELLRVRGLPLQRRPRAAHARHQEGQPRPRLAEGRDRAARSSTPRTRSAASPTWT